MNRFYTITLALKSENTHIQACGIFLMKASTNFRLHGVDGHRHLKSVCNKELKNGLIKIQELKASVPKDAEIGDLRWLV